MRKVFQSGQPDHAPAAALQRVEGELRPGCERRGDQLRRAVPRSDEAGVDARDTPDLACELVVRRETHQQPGDRVGRLHRRGDELVEMPALHRKMRLARTRQRAFDKQVHRAGESAVERRRGRDEIARRVDHEEKIGLDPTRVVRRGREDRRRIARRDRLAETEVGGHHRDAARELARAELEHLKRVGAAGRQLLGRPCLDVPARAREHCDHRHGLRDGDQPDDQHEKPVAKALHGTGCNDLT